MSRKVWVGSDWQDLGSPQYGPRPYVVGAAAVSQSVALTTITAANSATNYAVDDLVTILVARDGSSGNTVPYAATPAGTYGWAQMGGAEHRCMPIMHRYEDNVAEPASFSAGYTATSASPTQVASVLGIFRGVGEVQESDYVTWATATGLTLGSMTVEQDNSLAVCFVQIHVQTSGTNAVYGGTSYGITTPAGWTAVATASRWNPAVGIFVKNVDAGASGSAAFAGTAAYQASRLNGGVMKILKPARIN